ncbi:hypothetical protein AN958_07714 [Leucoagaricus sp. SymC.cos]|nr:hypothetical protein AN958_07714 [Leucoagaricus sp. SymC.cos]
MALFPELLLAYNLLDRGFIIYHAHHRRSLGLWRMIGLLTLNNLLSLSGSLSARSRTGAIPVVPHNVSMQTVPLARTTPQFTIHLPRAASFDSFSFFSSATAPFSSSGGSTSW